MDGLDPGWFYSSLAQASAAIVGLVGAILGSRVVDHLAKMRGERGQLDSLVAGVRNQIGQQIDHLTAYRNFLTQEIAEDRNALSTGQERRNITHEMSWGGSSSGSHPIRVSQDRLLLKEQNLDLLTGQVLPLYIRLPEVISSAEIRVYAQRLRVAAEQTPEPRDQAGQPKALLRGDAQVLDGLADAVERFREKLLPASYLMVFLILGWIAAFGVFWPLSALPGLPAYPKTPMLYGVAVGMLGLMAYFVYQFIELWRLRKNLKP